MIEIKYDNKDHFQDITEKEDSIRYNETEELSGHTFCHVAYGIFAAVPAFYADEAELIRLKKAYPDVA